MISVAGREPTHQILSLGGGVQSTALLLMAHHGEIEPPDLAIFSDTGWEPGSVYSHLRWLQANCSIPMVWVSNGRNLRDESAGWNADPEDDRLSVLSLPVYVLNEDGTRGMMQHRQCTDKWKIRPIRRYIREGLLGLGPRQRVPSGVSVEQWFGISTDEAMRMRDADNGWTVNRYPLIELGMSRQDCKDWFMSRYPGRELPKSACSGCPFRSDGEWLSLKKTDPADFAEAARVDSDIRRLRHARGFSGTPYLHQRRKPLEEAVADYERHLEMNPTLPGMETGAGNDCSGICYS